MFPLTAHKEPFLRSIVFTHFAQSESLPPSMLQMSFKTLTLLASFSDLKPSPPSDFGLHKSFQATFDLRVLNEGPDHKKAPHKLSIFLMH